ncbi:glycosyltransferase 87 family protein [Algoriphagus sp.]|uniref:glycosyltransferase 87 family protein n=1 Tax=Algoriphagus sp. TaxID=1872435 RepID=UPI0025D12A3B|nr:glycosyltransferase 87 family protein [Algoriphagus sp.]
MKIPLKPILQFTLWLCLLAGIFVLSFIPRDNFISTLLIFSACFLILGILYFSIEESRERYIWWFTGGLFLRLVLLVSIPKWSEDYARFLWDGELIRLEQNPYLETPKDWLVNHPSIKSPYLENLFELMNSPEYYSVYPPSNQFLFWITSIGAKQDPWQGIVVLRILLILSEILVFFLLLQLFKTEKIPPKTLLLYWFNPFIILEIISNLHFEGLVLVFLLLALLAFGKAKTESLGGFWSLAIGVKILPLMLGPSFLFSEKIRKSYSFWLVSFFGLVVLFSPLLWESSWKNFLESLRLYQGKFEFNASIYYLFREVGFWIKGYNTIASLTKLLSLLTLFGIAYFAWKKKPNTIVQMAEVWTMSYLVYLILQPVVHPWYIIPAFGLSLLTKIRSLTVWTFTAIFSYQAYSNQENYENPWLLLLEYGMVGLALLWDYKKGNINLRSEKIQSYES